MRPPNLTTDNETALRVFMLIRDQPIYCCGVQSIVSEGTGLFWCGAASSFAEACELARELPQPLWPEVVLVDDEILLAPDSGMTLRDLKQQLPAARFIALSRAGRQVPATELMALGADAVLAKSVSASQLLAAIHATHSGLGLFDATAGLPATAAAAARPDGEIGADLTRRERDLLALMAKGLSNHDISSSLNIAVPTVKFHVGNILSKLHAYNRTAAVLTALRHNLVELD